MEFLYGMNGLQIGALCVLVGVMTVCVYEVGRRVGYWVSARVKRRPPAPRAIEFSALVAAAFLSIACLADARPPMTEEQEALVEAQLTEMYGAGHRWRVRAKVEYGRAILATATASPRVCGERTLLLLLSRREMLVSGAFAQDRGSYLPFTCEP